MIILSGSFQEKMYNTRNDNSALGSFSPPNINSPHGQTYELKIIFPLQIF